MKNLIFILLLMPVSLFAQDFGYNRVTTVSHGTDGFSLDQTTDKDITGDITLNGRILLIDGKEFKLKKKLSENSYKSNGCIVRLKYCGDNLCWVHIDQIDQDKFYRINNTHIAINNK